MTFDVCTVQQFMNAWFKKDFSLMTNEEFEFIYTSYIDISGIAINEDFDKVSYIHFLKNRITCVNAAIELQRRFVADFGLPALSELSFFEKFGYKINWCNDTILFFVELEKIETKEKRYVVELKSEIKKLEELRNKEKSNHEELSLDKQRERFIKLKNSLMKAGYSINNNETTIEEFALMYKAQVDEIESIKTKVNG